MANPNPSPATRFKPGQSGNPAGKSKAQAEREAKTSEIASIVTHMGLSKLQEKLENGEIDPVDILTGDILRFIKEAQDRAHGTPGQSINHTSDDGTMTPPATVALVPMPLPDDDSAG